MGFFCVFRGSYEYGAAFAVPENCLLFIRRNFQWLVVRNPLLLKSLKAKGTIKSVYFVACGGSYAGLHPGKYFLESESKELKVDHYSSNEFCHATPKSLGEHSIVITQSSSGNTPETVKAAEIAQKAGAASIVITNKPESPGSEWRLCPGS